MILCLFCHKHSENEKNRKDFSFSFISELLELSSDCQSEINSIKNSDIIDFNCVQCSSLLDKGQLILEQIKNLQKELIFIREKLWTELSSCDSTNRSNNENEMGFIIREILVKESTSNAKLNPIKYDIIIKTENESQSDENESINDEFITADFTFPPENYNSGEELEFKINPNEIKADPDYGENNNDFEDDDDGDSSNTDFSYKSEEEYSESDNESEEDYEFKKRRKKPKISKISMKKIKKESMTEEEEEEKTGIQKRKRGKYRKRKNSTKKELKEKPKRKRIKLDPNAEHYCDICQKKFSTIFYLRLHLKKSLHLNKVKENLGKEGKKIEIPLEECPVCSVFIAPSTFRSHFRADLHRKNEAEAPAELIKLLDEKWPNLPRNVPRYKLPRSKWKFKCEICEKMFVNTQKLNYHKRTRMHLLKEKELTGKDNSKELLINCEICNLSFLSQLNYTQHNKSERHLKNINETPEEKIERNCEICNILFPSKLLKKKHFEKVHKIGKPKDQKSIYKKSDENNERNQCEICGQNFTDIYNLKTHVKMVHEKVAKYFCKFCPFKSYFRYHVNDHMKRVHTNKSDWICDVCGKALPSKYSLYTHKYRYHSEPRFKCSDCPKKFREKQKYKRHLYSHLPQEKWPFHCPECGKAHVNKDNYESHLSTHSPELKDSVKCDICDKTYSHKMALYHHQVKAHKNEKKVTKKAKAIIVDNVEDLI